MYDSDKGGIFLSNKSYLSRAKRIVVIQSFFYSFILHFFKGYPTKSHFDIILSITPFSFLFVFR